MPSSWILARLVREGLAPDSRVPSLREGIVLSDRRWWNLLRLTGLVLLDQFQDRIVGPPSAVFSLLKVLFRGNIRRIGRIAACLVRRQLSELNGGVST